jgi:hypothetical protein
VIERVVENWLTNANERQYQIPFCQVLAAEGETIVYVSPHGQREQGKDVITIARDRIPCAYQLKAGRVALNDWRKYHGEINELVTYPIDHPSIRSRKTHRPYLVTNGSVADPVLSAIKSANRHWVRSKAKGLTLIAGDQLVSRFVKSHGSYLPSKPNDFRMLLDLIARGGPDPFSKSDYARFLDTLLPSSGTHRLSHKDLGRLSSSIVLLTTYIVQGCEQAQNHWSAFEAWVMAGSYVLGLAQRYAIPERFWATSFDLTELAAIRALEGLAEECEKNERLFTQGIALTDGEVYGSRITLLCGLLSALNLHRRIRGVPTNPWVQEFLSQYLSKIRLWGESAVPYLWLGALETEEQGHHARSEGLLFLVLKTLVEVNSRRIGRALPNPYYGPESSIRLAIGLDPTNLETFNGHSYTAEPLIDFFARRLSRRSLASIWEKITRIQFVDFTVTEDWEWFRWRAKHGASKTTIPKMPESWARLVAHARDEPKHLPKLIRERPHFAVLFALVFPHRFSCGLAALVEGALGLIDS